MRKRRMLVTMMTTLAMAEARAQLRVRIRSSGFTTPVAFVHDPLDRDIQFVVQQDGHIRAVQNGNVLAADSLDVAASVISGGEQGLLGMAFTPDTAVSGRFFINFTNRAGHTVIARFRRASAVTADAASRFDLRWGSQAFIAQPFANHNGGHLDGELCGSCFLAQKRYHGGHRGSAEDTVFIFETHSTAVSTSL